MKIHLLLLLLLSVSTTLFADCHSDAKEIGHYYTYSATCLPWDYNDLRLCQFGNIGNAIITGSNGKCKASHVLCERDRGQSSGYFHNCTFYWDKGNWGKTLRGQ